MRFFTASLCALINFHASSVDAARNTVSNWTLHFEHCMQCSKCSVQFDTVLRAASTEEAWKLINAHKEAVKKRIALKNTSPAPTITQFKIAGINNPSFIYCSACGVRSL